jgi:hypothetical protein
MLYAVSRLCWLSRDEQGCYARDEWSGSARTAEPYAKPRFRSMS